MIFDVKKIFVEQKGLLEITYENIQCSYVINNRASSEEINSVNAYFDHRLPNDYLSFLGICNGCILFKVEDSGGFEFYGASQLINENTFQRNNFHEDWSSDIIIFCSCTGDGDYVGFKMLNNNSCEIIDCFGEEVPANWKAIGNSFSDFLEKLILSKGKKFWLFQDEL